MNVPRFSDEDLRILADLAIDYCTTQLFFKVVRQVVNKPNDKYWCFDCRFSHDEDQLDTHYDSLYIDCGNYNEPETYQMSWNTFKNGELKIKPIASPLLVVHYFDQMCKKNQTQLQ